MIFDLPHIWAGIIAFAILAYVALDGMDLGIGLIFPFLPGRDRRDVMMNSVAPVWDGNETWLVTRRRRPFRRFSTGLRYHYACALSTFDSHAAGASLSRVSFEYRWRAETKGLWDVAFFGGSFVAALCKASPLGHWSKV